MIDERKKRVIDLYYNEGRSTRDIARIERMSIRDISSILKEEAAKKQSREDQLKSQSDEISAAKAYRLFEEGETPVQVAIDLELKEPTVSAFYKEYMRLKGLAQVVQLWEKIEGDVWAYLDLYDLGRLYGINNETIVKAANTALSSLPYVEQRHRTLKKESETLQNNVDRLHIDIRFLEDKKSKLKEEINGLVKGIVTKEQELDRLHKEEERIRELSNNHQLLKPKEVLPMQASARQQQEQQNESEDIAFEGEVQAMNEGDIV
jgi:hypothetical protein